MNNRRILLFISIVILFSCMIWLLLSDKKEKPSINKQIKKLEDRSSIIRPHLSQKKSFEINEPNKNINHLETSRLAIKKVRQELKDQNNICEKFYKKMYKTETYVSALDHARQKDEVYEAYAEQLADLRETVIIRNYFQIVPTFEKYIFDLKEVENKEFRRIFDLFKVCRDDRVKMYIEGLYEIELNSNQFQLLTEEIVDTVYLMLSGADFFKENLLLSIEMLRLVGFQLDLDENYHYELNFLQERIITFDMNYWTEIFGKNIVRKPMSKYLEYKEEMNLLATEIKSHGMEYLKNYFKKH